MWKYQYCANDSISTSHPTIIDVAQDDITSNNAVVWFHSLAVCCGEFGCLFGRRHFCGFLLKSPEHNSGVVYKYRDNKWMKHLEWKILSKTNKWGRITNTRTVCVRLDIDSRQKKIVSFVFVCGREHFEVWTIDHIGNRHEFFSLRCFVCVFFSWKKHVCCWKSLCNIERTRHETAHKSFGRGNWSIMVMFGMRLQFFSSSSVALSLSLSLISTWISNIPSHLNT